MGGLRVRWRTVAKASALLCAALVALRVLPGLFEPAPPPPVAEDVGLTHLVQLTAGCRSTGCPRSAGENASRAGIGPASALGRVRRQKPRAPARRERAPTPASPTSTPSPPLPATASYPPLPAPAPPPAPAPVPSPPPASAAPSDGSEEFAPH